MHLRETVLLSCRSLFLPQVLIGPLIFTLVYSSLTFPRDHFYDIYLSMLHVQCHNVLADLSFVHFFSFPWLLLLWSGYWLPRVYLLPSFPLPSFWNHIDLLEFNVCW